MGLDATGGEAIERAMSAGFLVPMRDGDKAVTVVVAHEALDAFSPGAPDAAAALREKRSHIEEIARAKYENGVIAANGHVLISARDLRGR